MQQYAPILFHIGFPVNGEKLAYQASLGRYWGMTWSLYDGRARRKYLLMAERRAFLQAALDIGGQTASFCAVLVLCGARISEILALTSENIDDANCAINFRTLKRRQKTIRSIPVPKHLLQYLDGVHHYKSDSADPKTAIRRLWPFSRTTAWRRVKRVMQNAGIPQFVSQPKSLRHAFGAEACMNHIALTLVKKWLGHARIETTEIYTSLIGEEERSLARLMWRDAESLLDQ